MRRSRDSRDANRFDNKTRQVCALAERALTLALAEFEDPLLHSLQVTQVLPAPTIARLLVVVQPVVAVNGDQIERIMTALEARRGVVRRELGAELNRKKTPELTFTIGTAEELAPEPRDRDTPCALPEDTASDQGKATFALAAARVGAHAHSTHVARTAKRERPRNEKRALKRQQRVVERREAASAVTPTVANATSPSIPSLYDVVTTGAGVPIKAWTRGVPVEAEALAQLRQVAELPIVSPWVAAMPDVHVGIGATVGCVVPTHGAIIPAAVGVDIGCGMMAVRTTLEASQLPDSLFGLRNAI